MTGKKKVFIGTSYKDELKRSEAKSLREQCLMVWFAAPCFKLMCAALSLVRLKNFALIRSTFSPHRVKTPSLHVTHATQNEMHNYRHDNMTDECMTVMNNYNRRTNLSSISNGQRVQG